MKYSSRFIPFWLSVWLVVLSVQSIPAFASDPIIGRSFLLDPTNQATYQDVKELAFTPYTHVFNGGFSPGAFWIKIQLTPSNQDMVLSVKPPYIDDIDVYVEGVQTDSIRNGGLHLGHANELGALPYGFLLPPSDRTRDIFLRFKSAHSYHIAIDVFPMPEFIEQDGLEKLIYIGYTTFSLALALWLFIIWLLDRNAVVGAFTLQQFAGFIHSFITAGFAQFFWFETPAQSHAINHLSFLLIVSYPLIGFIANTLLLKELSLTKPYLMFTKVLMASCLVVIVMFLLGHLTIIKWNAVLLLIGMAFFWLASWFGLAKPNLETRPHTFLTTSIKIYYSVNLIIWVIAVLPLLGIWDVGLIAFHSLFAYNVLSGLMLFFLLQSRFKFRLEHALATKSALQIQAASERQQREELGMMMAMLSHEIKTPLSVLRLVVDDRVKGSDLEGHANRAISNINFVINRCLQLGQLDSESIQIAPRTFKIADAIKAVILDYGTTNSSRINLTGDSSISLTTDLNLFQVVVSNLVDNALKYSPAGSKIDINCHHVSQQDDSHLQLSMSNQAGAFGSPEAPHVFKKYYRNRFATKVAGSGLGLFLVARLLEILGGHIDYMPEKGLVVFCLRIPIEYRAR